MDGPIADVTLRHIAGQPGQCSDLFEFRGIALMPPVAGETQSTTLEFVTFTRERPSEGLTSAVLPLVETQYGNFKVTPLLTVPAPTAVYVDGQLTVEVWERDAVRIRLDDTNECTRLDGAWDCSPTTLTLALDRTDDSEGRPLLTSEAYIEMCAVPGTELAEGFEDWDGVPVCEYESCL